MQAVLITYRGIPAQDFMLGRILQMLLVFGILGMTLCEIGFYISIFKQRKNSNENVRSMLTLEAINSRHRNNVITFGGQILVSIAEITTDFLVIFRRFFIAQSSSILLPQIIGIQVAIVSLFTIVASPEIRRFLTGLFQNH